jgi:hypothetical protein
MPVSFKGAHFPQEIILMGVRWDVAYPLSYGRVEELMEECGVPVAHAAIQRWLVKYSAQLEEAFHRRERPVGHSWRAIERLDDGSGTPAHSRPAMAPRPSPDPGTGRSVGRLAR